MEYLPISLSALSDGGTAVVLTLSVSDALQRRLLELGLIPGTRIRCLYRAPSGSPIACALRGTVVALRSADAANILVCPEAAP